MKRRIDWTAHARALRKGRKDVARAAPSPAEVDGRAGHHDAMQLAAWGVPWPPPKGWKAGLAELWRRQQEAAPEAGAEPQDQRKALGRRSKAELIEELLECQSVIWGQLERIAQLRREAMGTQGQGTTERFTAGQIRLGGMEYERQTAVEWLREVGKPALAAAMERGEHHGRKRQDDERAS